MFHGIFSLDMNRMEVSSFYALAHCLNNPLAAQASRSFGSGLLDKLGTGKPLDAHVVAVGIQEKIDPRSLSEKRVTQPLGH